MKICNIMRPDTGIYELRAIRKTPIITISLIIINVIVYIITSINNNFLSISNEWLLLGGYIPLRLNNLSEIYRLFTSMFMHADLIHIFFNMYFLYLFGRAVENVIGRFRFLCLYIGSGLAASIFHTALSIIQGVEAIAVPAIGASGAISGVLGAYLLLFPRTSLTACWFFFYLPVCFTVKAAYYLVFWFALQVIYGYAKIGAVAFFAHAGGFLGGMTLLPLVIDKERHTLLKLMMSRERVFEYIVYRFIGLKNMGLGGVKIILSVLILALLMNSVYALSSSNEHSENVYALKTYADYLQCIYNRCSTGSQVDFLVIDLEMKKVLNTPIQDMIRVLLNRLDATGYIYNATLSNWNGTISWSGYVYVAKLPVMLRLNMIAQYNDLGLLQYAYGQAETEVLHCLNGICKPTEIIAKYKEFRIETEGPISLKNLIQIPALISIIISIYALYTVLKKDKELEIV